ncbi:MAG: hypothetical protein L3I91_00520 [Mycoplasma sp.]
MRKPKRIGFNLEIVTELITNILSITPGVDMSQPIDIDLVENKSIPTITVRFFPTSDIINLYDLCINLQDLIYYKIVKGFDLDKSNIKILVQ